MCIIEIKNAWINLTRKNAFEKDCGSEGEKRILAQLVSIVPACG
jgi:hypothetical protein